MKGRRRLDDTILRTQSPGTNRMGRIGQDLSQWDSRGLGQTGAPTGLQQHGDLGRVDTAVSGHAFRSQPVLVVADPFNRAGRLPHLTRMRRIAKQPARVNAVQ